MAADALSFSYRDSSATVIGRLVSQGAVSAPPPMPGPADPRLTARQVADRCMAAMFRLDTYESGVPGGRSGHRREPAASSSPPTGWQSPTTTPSRMRSPPPPRSPPGMSTKWAGDLRRSDINIAVIRVSRTALEGHDTTAFTPPWTSPPPGTGDLRVGDTVYAIGNPWAWGWQSAPASSAPRSGMWSDTPCPAS